MNDPRGPVNSHDIFSDTPYDHPLPYTDKRGHGEGCVNANSSPGERPFLEAGEEGGAD